MVKSSRIQHVEEDMPRLEHGGDDLGRIHAKNNDKKYFCHLTGFLEGVAASGYLEKGEIEPLISECLEFVERVSDGDADDIVQDFVADLLDYESIRAIAEIRAPMIDTSCDKSSVNRFLGYSRGIACDGQIRVEEAQGIVDLIQSNTLLLNTIGVRQIYVTCSDALVDGIIDGDESAEICKAISEIVGDSYGDTGIASAFGVAVVRETSIKDIEVEFIDRNVVLTGTFAMRPRTLLEERLASFGAEVARSVSGSTHFVIIGGEASRDWIEMNRGSKIRKAQELRLKTGLPHFVSEAQLMGLLAKR